MKINTLLSAPGADGCGDGRPVEALHERGQRQVFPGAGAGPRPHRPAEGQLRGSRRPPVQPGEDPGDPVAKVELETNLREV